MTKHELQQYRTIKLELAQLNRECERLYTILERCVRAPSRAPGYAGEHNPYPDIMDKLTAVQVDARKRAGELLECASALRQP